MRSPPGGHTTPEDPVRTELASIFAAAILRLRKHSENQAPSDANGSSTCLEVSPQTGLIGHRG